MIFSTKVLLISLSLINAVTGVLTNSQKDKVNDIAKLFSIPDDAINLFERIYEDTYQLVGNHMNQTIRDTVAYNTIHSAAHIFGIAHVQAFAQGFAMGHVQGHGVGVAQGRAQGRAQAFAQAFARERAQAFTQEHAVGHVQGHGVGVTQEHAQAFTQEHAQAFTQEHAQAFVRGQLLTDDRRLFTIQGNCNRGNNAAL